MPPPLQTESLGTSYSLAIVLRPNRHEPSDLSDCQTVGNQAILSS
jgi:hypothetical protein